MSGYRCCRHCADDPVHDVPTDGHSVPCGTPFGVCSDGGDEWRTKLPPGIVWFERDDDDWCYGCDSPIEECLCG